MPDNENDSRDIRSISYELEPIPVNELEPIPVTSSNGLTTSGGLSDNSQISSADVQRYASSIIDRLYESYTQPNPILQGASSAYEYGYHNRLRTLTYQQAHGRINCCSLCRADIERAGWGVTRADNRGSGRYVLTRDPNGDNLSYCWDTGEYRQIVDTPSPAPEATESETEELEEDYICTRCASEIDSDDAIELDGDYYCNCCVDDCSGCGETHIMDDLNRCHHCGEWLCYDCRYSCENCGGRYCRDCLTDDWECSRCDRDNFSWEEFSDQPTILDYHHRGYVRSQHPMSSAEWEVDGKGKLGLPYNGIEWELNFRSDKWGKVSEIAKQHLYGKHVWMYDSSVGQGAELIIAPHTIDAIDWKSWKAMCDEMRSAGASGYRSGQCGIHIHLSKRSLTPKMIQRIQALMLVYGGFLLKFSKRSNDDDGLHYCQPNTRLDGYWNEKYLMLNCSPRHTIEFRLFRSTTNYARIRASLELVNAMREYAAEYSLAHILATAKASYSDCTLWDYLSDKGRYGFLKRYLDSQPYQMTPDKKERKLWYRSSDPSSTRDRRVYSKTDCGMFSV